MNRTVAVLLFAWLALAWPFLPAAAQGTAPPNAAAEMSPEDRELLTRLTSEKNEPVLLGVSWTVAHCATEDGKARAENVFAVVEGSFGASGGHRRAGSKLSVAQAASREHSARC